MDPNKTYLAKEEIYEDIQGFNQGFFQSAGQSPGARTETIFSNVITVFTIFGGLAFAFWFIIGAVNWITSTGNSDQVEKAKGQMSSAIVGLVVLVLATSITYVLGKILGLDILNFDIMVGQLSP